MLSAIVAIVRVGTSGRVENNTGTAAAAAAEKRKNKAAAAEHSILRAYLHTPWHRRHTDFPIAQIQTDRLYLASTVNDLAVCFAIIHSKKRYILNSSSSSN